MIPKWIRALAPVALALIATACSSTDRPASTSALPRGVVRITTASGSVELNVQIAETDEARQRGLMGVRSLAPDAGMAFLFDGPTDVSFWMKDTLIALSIAFWDEQGRIVGIREMTPCRHDPCPLYSPGAAYIAAAEATRGFFASHGVRVGDPVRLIPEEEPLGDRGPQSSNWLQSSPQSSTTQVSSPTTEAKWPGSMSRYVPGPASADPPSTLS
jgi:uncharacterized membrane protein (UPF0127 family)